MRRRTIPPITMAATVTNPALASFFGASSVLSFMGILSLGENSMSSGSPRGELLHSSGWECLRIKQSKEIFSGVREVPIWITHARINDATLTLRFSKI